MDDGYDNDALISAIKSEELIWNYKIKDHSDRIKKNNAWATVCVKVIENFDEKSTQEKNKLATSLQKKWKVLRDGYSRYMKKIKPKSGSAAPNVRPYAYHQQLSFLKAVMEERPDRTDSLTESEGTETSKILEENDNSQSTPRMKKNNYKRKLSTAKEDILIEKLTKRLESTSPNRPVIEDDEDKMFLLSLAGDFKKINDQYKLDARTEIINVLKHFKGMSQYSYPSYGDNRGYSSAPSTASSDQHSHYYPSYSNNRSYSSTPSTSTRDRCSPTPLQDNLAPSSVLSDDIISNIFE